MDERPIYTVANYLDRTTSSVSYLNSGFMTGNGTGLNIVYGDDSVWVGGGGIAVQGTAVKKRYPEKKIKGDMKGANDPSKRLTLLKPTIIYQYIKDRFKPIEQKRLEKRFEIICEILHNAQATQQVALVEKIRTKFDPFIREQELLSCRINAYINEKTLEAFVNATPNKIIKITPLKNYVRIIPKRVQKKLEETQQKKLFDSYVVVHTDPNDTAVEKTEAEKKDPILFGIINGSKKYYFIDDWKDELCSLTMNQIIDTLDLQKEDYELPEEVDRSLLDMLLSDDDKPKEQS
jgi:hypothetical protein